MREKKPVTPQEIAALKRRFSIREDDKVLDVGCGADPFPLATHLSDKSLTDDSERFGPFPRTDLPAFECPVEKMPFADKEFDFVYCSHVLEHVDDPAAACRELIRVAKRGYIECPYAWHEIVFHSRSHKWLVDHERRTLIFREKLEEETKDVLGIQEAILDIENHPEIEAYFESRATQKLRQVEFYWEDTFDFLVIPRSERKQAGLYPSVYSDDYLRQPEGDAGVMKWFLYNHAARNIRQWTKTEQEKP